MYEKYLNETFSELTKGKIYKVQKLEPYGVLSSITIINDKNRISMYLYNERDFTEVTDEYVRNETITEMKPLPKY